VGYHGLSNSLLKTTQLCSSWLCQATGAAQELLIFSLSRLCATFGFRMVPEVVQIGIGPCWPMLRHASSCWLNDDQMTQLPANVMATATPQACQIRTKMCGTSTLPSKTQCFVFNEFGPEQSFCCGVVTPTCKNDKTKTTECFARKCKSPRPLAPKP